MNEIENKGPKDVIDYWDKNPVHSIEFDLNTDLRGYCEYIDALRWSDNEKWARDKFYEFKGEGELRILDAGCGIGVFSRFYARKGPRFKVCAIDITPKAVEITQKSFKIFGLEGEIRLGSVEELPYPDNYFDYIVSNGVIHHTLNTQRAVDEFYRVLKPGGQSLLFLYQKTLHEEGEDEKNFKIGVFLGEEKVGEGEGISKQDAQQQAAEDALKKLGWG